MEEGRTEEAVARVVVTASVAAMVAAMVAMVVTAVAAVTAVPRLCEHHRPGTLHHHAERVVMKLSLIHI